MRVRDLSLPGLKLICPHIFFDERGCFVQTYQASSYAQAGIHVAFVQDNHSYSQKNVLRGMHFQRNPGQAKLVSVIEGEIYDVAVDIRPDSCTFGKWEGVYLDGKSRSQLFIPVGFAHGFCVISSFAHVIYKVSSNYDPSEEKGFHFHDPDVGIKWPIDSPILSLKDKEAPGLKELLS